MEQCRFYAAGAAALAPALGRLTALTFLDISHNALFGWDGGGQHLAPALARLTRLKRLYLGSGEPVQRVDRLRSQLPASVCVTTETRHLDRPGQLSEFEQDNNRTSEQERNT